jgi:purine-nucleoside phosphorylase
VSVLTDECDPDNLEPIDIQDILATAAIAEPKMVLLFKELIKTI